LADRPRGEPESEIQQGIWRWQREPEGVCDESNQIFPTRDRQQIEMGGNEMANVAIVMPPDSQTNSLAA
jgi:hypothetical protein